MTWQNIFNEQELSLWESFIKDAALSDKQAEQFASYLLLLQEWNARMNLTALTDSAHIIHYHFQDSLAALPIIKAGNYKALADVGTGAGFPALPLKICLPDMPMYLIEVNKKKIHFLEMVIQELGLENVTLVAYDWRTFLRKSSFDIDLFCVRASLSMQELMRAFKPSSSYHHAAMIYWAAIAWKPEDEVVQYVKEEVPYSVGNKKRKLVVMKSPA